jgi:hypothetical protein
MICDNVRHDRRTHVHIAPGRLVAGRPHHRGRATRSIQARLARVPTRVTRTALMGMIGGAGMVILWIEVFWRHHP